MSDRTVRLRFLVESGELEQPKNQLEQLVRLEKELVEAIKQSALSANANSSQQVTAINAVSDALQKQKKATDDTNKATKETSDNLNVLSSGVKSFVGLVAGAFAISEIKSFGEQIIDAKTKIDSVKIALDTMIGSKRESAELYQQIVQLAKSTPFSLQEVSEQVSKLKAYNIETADLIPTITALGNIAAAVGKEKLPQLTLAYGQVRNANVLMGTELRQFTEAGVPLLDLIAKSYDKTKESVVKMAADHEISFAMVRKALMDASAEGGKYNDMMVKMSKTVGGQISNLADDFFVAKGRIGDFFEDQIAGGTKILQNLIQTLAGSQSAIQRTVTYVESIAAAFVTWKVAMNAQAVASASWTLATKAAEAATGAYNLMMITIKGTTEGFTRAQQESAVASRAMFSTLSANPIGAIVAVVGLATTAYLAWKAAHVEVTEAMGDQEYSIRREKDDLNRLAETALNAATGSKKRKEAIAELIATYPDYFSGLDTEKTSNNQLKSILDKVNLSYEERIALAKQAYQVDKLTEKQRSLWDEEAAAIGRLVARVPELKQFGNDAASVLDYLSKNAEANFKARNSNSFGSWLDSVTNGNPVVTLQNLKKNLDDVDSQLKTATETRKKATEVDQKNEVDAIKAHYEVLRQQADGNAKRIAAINVEEKAAIKKATQDDQRVEIQELASHEDKKKTVTLLSAKEIAVIRKDSNAIEQTDRLKDLKDQLDTLKKREDQEIESATKIIVSRKITNAQLAALEEQSRKDVAAIVAKYDLERAKIMEQIEQETMARFLKSAKETNDKIEVLTAQRLEAEKMLTKLNDANTNEERLAVLREYNNKFVLEQKNAAVEQLKTQLDNSAKELADIKVKNGEKGDEYRKAYTEWQKDNLAYNQALKDQTVTAAKETAEQIKAYEQEIRQAKQETAQLDKETAAIQTRSTKELINLGINLLGQQSGLLGQLGTSIRAISDNIDALSSKAVQAGADMIEKAKNDLLGIQMIYSDGSAQGDAMIAKANLNVAEAENKAAKVKADSDAALMGITSAVVQTILAIAQAIRERLSEAYKAAAESVAYVREANQELYALIEQGSRESYEAALAAAQGSLEQQLAIVEDFYARQDELARSTVRIDAELAYAQKFFELRSEQKKFLSAFEQEEKDREYQAQARHFSELIRAQSVLDELDRRKEKLREVRDTEIQYINDQLQRFKEAKQEEIDAENAALAARKANTELFYSDKELRLQADDVYRFTLLAAGEAREIAALEAAKQRELQRAAESSATAEEVARIDESFEKLKAEVQAKYADARGQKEKEVSLANQEVKAREKDEVNRLEADSASKTTALQNQIAQQEAQSAYDRAVANGKYAQAVWETNAAIWEQTKQLKILELQAEIAKLESQKSWTGIGNGAINAAISTVQGLIGQIQGMGYGASRPQGTDPSIAIVDGNRQQTGSNDTIRYQVDMNKAGKNVGGPGRPVREDNLALLGEGTDVGLFLNGNTVRLSYDVGGKRTALKDGSGNTVWVAFAHGYSMDKDGNQIDRFFKGTPYVELGNHPKGRDTIPALVNEGERIVPTVLNNVLGGKNLSNEQLVDKVLFHDRFVEAFPQMANMLVGASGGSVMKLPDELMRPQSVDVSGLRKDLNRVVSAIENKKLVAFNFDRNGFTTSLHGQQSKTTYYQNLLTQ